MRIVALALVSLASACASAPAPTPAAVVPPPAAYEALGGGHLLRDTRESGRFLTLEDGSRWEVHPRDRFQTADWETDAPVTVRTTRAEDGFAYEIVNTQADEGALARPLPRR